MPTPKGRSQSFMAIRTQLDKLGYYQTLTPDSLPLVEALLHDLLATTHNLKMCKENKKGWEERNTRSTGNESPRSPLDNNVTAHDVECAEKLRQLDDKVQDLELLNEQALNTVKRLQEESVEKSKKILKLEMASNKASVSVQCNKPKLELKSFVRPNKHKGHHCDPSPVDVDVIKMYDRKNKALVDEMHTIQAELDDARSLLNRFEKEYRQQKNQSRSKTPEANVQSAYIMKLLKENERLKDTVSGHENPKGCPPKQCCHHVCHPVRSPDDIRSAVEQSHIQLHNACLRNQVSHLSSVSDSAAKVSHQHMDEQHKQIHSLQEQLKEANCYIKDLEKRIAEISATKSKLKDKNQNLKKQLDIVLDSAENTKARNLIQYIENQRDIYKNQVESLIKNLHCSDGNSDDASGVSSGSSSESRSSSSIAREIKVLKDIQNDSKRKLKQVEVRQADPYSPTAYKSTPEDRKVWDDELRRWKSTVQRQEETIQRLEKERFELEKRMMNEIQQKEVEVKMLEDKVAYLQLEADDANRKSRNKNAELRDEVDSSLQGLQRDLRLARQNLERVTNDLSIKESHIKSLSRDKDALNSALDDRTIALEDAKNKLNRLESQVAELESTKGAQEKRVSQCLLEIQHLQSQLHEAANSKEEIKDKMMAEKNLGRDLITENRLLKQDTESLKRDLADSRAEVSDLKARIQKYVNEVKRVEELISIREKERLELFEQYKHLSLEVETAESHNRKMESKIADLNMELDSKDTELTAVSKRLADMEKELVETTVANENYRSQIAILSSKVEMADSELRESRSQQTWINEDLTSVHQLAAQLNTQKFELQNKISEQDDEIAALTSELETLRQQVVELSERFERERDKNKRLEDIICDK